jgi:hypothetical protein
MKYIIPFVFVVLMAGNAAAVQKGDSADPVFGVEVLPQSNRSAAAIAADATASTASVSAVTVSSSVITRIDTAFNAAALSALGATYQRAEITVQNNDTTDKFCGYSSTALTISNGFKIAVGAVWSFKVGKGIGVYCLNAAGASGTLIVGGVAWK